MSIQYPRKPFYLDEYLETLQTVPNSHKLQLVHSISQMDDFLQLCNEVKQVFMSEWESAGKGKDSGDETQTLLETQKKAIIGYVKEVNYFKGKINDYLKKNNLSSEWFPSWYDDLTSAIFHENWGLTGIMEWKNMKNSSSCKIIGERIYFLIDGKQQLQKQTISKDRLNQLITALLLRTPEIRMDDDYAELYMLDGTRITIYEQGLAKEPIVVFRKYIVDQYTFEEQARRGTIPQDLVPLFEAMVQVGFNVGFLGPVRTGKSTFLATWQSYEDPTLEGIQVETDPEIPLHVIMPKAPIMQLLADGEKLKKIIKILMRGDGDYLIMAEARDGVALKTAVQATSKGTRRVKITFHSSDAVDFCYDAANEIIQEFGGDIWATTIKIAKSFHYLFEFVQLKDKSKKRLKGIYEVRYDPRTLDITLHQICKYHFRSDTWAYAYDIGEDKQLIADQEDYEAFEVFKAGLRKLALAHPIEGVTVTALPYLKFMLNK